MSKLSVEEAWNRVKALWPSATYLRRVFADQCEIEGKGGYQTYTDNVIDWPEGVDRWPPKDEWKHAEWPSDWNKPCRCFLHDDAWEDGIDGVIVGQDRGNWLVRDTNNTTIVADECQVRIEPNGLSDGWQPMESAPKDGSIVQLMMGETPVKGYFGVLTAYRYSEKPSLPLSWDERNQPTAWKPL